MIDELIFLGNREKNFLDRANINQFENFLVPVVKKIKLSYKRNGAPIAILDVTKRLIEDLNQIPKSRKSVEFAKILSVQAQMLIAIGKDEEILKAALSDISNSIEILLGCKKISEETNKEFVKNTLILSVILKALGDFDFSIKTMNENSKFFLFRRGGLKSDLIMLQRQVIMMEQTTDGHKKLLLEAPFYKKIEPVEYYSTLKRIFEYSQNNDMFKLAEKIVPELKSAFEQVRKNLPPLSHISFIKNIGQYHINKGETALGMNLLQFALNHSTRLNLFGQRAQIEQLVSNFNSGNKVQLNTFKVRK